MRKPCLNRSNPHWIPIYPRAGQKVGKYSERFLGTYYSFYIPHPNRISTKAVYYLRKLESSKGERPITIVEKDVRVGITIIPFGIHKENINLPVGIKIRIVPQDPQPAFYPKMYLKAPKSFVQKGIFCRLVPRLLLIFTPAPKYAIFYLYLRHKIPVLLIKRDPYFPPFPLP